jgi:hypothetical protein
LGIKAEIQPWVIRPPPFAWHRRVVAGAATLWISLPLWPAVAARGEEESSPAFTVLVLVFPSVLL